MTNAEKFKAAACESDIRRAMNEVKRLRNENLRLKAELNKDDFLKLANDVDRLFAENSRLRDALKCAIPWACLKCTLWNSRAARCSLGSGACTQVRNWQELLEGGAK